MKTINDLYPKIYDFENIYAAWEEARKGKRYRTDVLKFSNNLEENLINIQNHLIYESYKMGKYHSFYVYEPKKRLVMSLPFPDRVVQWAIYRQLFPLLNKQFIFDSYACRKGKGTHSAADKLQYWLRQVDRKPERYYYLKLDISKFFYRIDHEILLKILRRKISDKKLLNLLSLIINSEETNFGLPLWFEPDMCTPEERLSEIGIPIGNLTSQMFANLYLNELDQLLKHKFRIHYYIRYMDDVIILHKDKKHLGYLKEQIELFLNDELHLHLNNKTTIRPISMGIDFVGFRIWPTYRKLKKATSNKIKTKVKHLVSARNRNLITEESLERSIASYKGILKHFNSYGFRKSLNKLFTK